MAYAPHTLVTLSGSLGEKTSFDEVWQIGIRTQLTAGGGPVDDEDLQGYCDEVAAIIDNWFSDVNTHIPSSVSLTQVKAANIGPDGHYSAAPGISVVAYVGGDTTAATVPSFCSVAYSWKTPIATGRRARRGRVYPPNFRIAVNAGLATISSASATTALAQAAELLDCIKNAAGNVHTTPSIFSSFGLSAPIDGIRVGNVYDVQRRRKYAVPETYTEANYLP